MRFTIAVLPLAATLLGCQFTAHRSLEVADDQHAESPYASRDGVQARFMHGDAPARPPAAVAPDQPAEQLTASVSAAMLMRSAQVAIEVDTLDTAIAAVRAIADDHGGFIANSSIRGRNARHRTALLQLRVPADALDRVLAGLPAIGRLTSLEVTSEDVGEEYVDVRARVANARRLEERLLRLIAARTGKLEEVLQAERELARVREQIERLEGRRRYLEGHANMSTVHVDLREPTPALDARWASLMAAAFRGAWRNFWSFTAVLVEALGIVIPLGVLALGAVLAWRRFPRTAATAARES